MAKSRFVRSGGRQRVRPATAWMESLEGRTLLSATPPNFTSGDTATGFFGKSISIFVTTTGSPTPKISENGTLPNGVMFKNNGDGTATISGIPFTTGSTGIYTFKLTAKNSDGTAMQVFTLDVSRAPAISSPPFALFNTIAGGTFTVKTNSYGSSVPTLALSNAPSGVLFVDNGDGTGTLTIPPNSVVPAGAYNPDNGDALTVTATNAAGASQQIFSLTVYDSPVFTSGSTFALTQNIGGAFTITTTGFPISTLTYKGTLPKGMTFNDNDDNTALISGTPMNAGSFPITIIAKNRLGTAVKQVLTITVAKATGFTTLPQTTFTVGKSGKYAIKTFGFPPATTLAIIGGLPPGVTFTDKGNGMGLLAGTPALGSAGVYNFTVSVDGGIATQFFTLTVN